jgi:hypothetical protein
MKKLLSIIGWIIHHETDRLVEVKTPCEHLKYTEYRVYRIHRIFGIPFRVIEAFFTDLGEGLMKRQLWYDQDDRKRYFNIN